MGSRIDTLIEGGTVVAGGLVSDATVAIGDGKIVGLLSPGVQVSDTTVRRIDAPRKNRHAHRRIVSSFVRICPDR
jgi:hypothetical protein